MADGLEEKNGHSLAGIAQRFKRAMNKVVNAK